MSSTQKAPALKGGVGSPSIIRHVVLFAICLLYLISYIDRGAISITAPQITKQFHFSATQMGFIFSAFSVTYSLLPVFVGALGDRRGARTILPILMGWWSVFTILTGIASSFASFIVIRLLFGLGESGSLPVYECTGKLVPTLGTWFLARDYPCSSAYWCCDCSTDHSCARNRVS